MSNPRDSSHQPHPLDRPGQGTASADLSDIELALEDYAQVRLAMEILEGNLRGDIATPAVRAALRHISAHLRASEQASLRHHGVIPRYLVITPISPLHPLPPEAMPQIAAALRTLDDHGLLLSIGTGD